MIKMRKLNSYKQDNLNQLQVNKKVDIFLIAMLNFIKNIKRFSSIRQKIRAERETRLGKSISQTILPTKSIQQIQKIRNIGIIAHIDAGKTTTTERMLYYAGALPSPGDIDQGTTTMDYMKQQRERGITIRSAAITFNWRKCQINLIDTPGHVDFSGEVARSLKVLDGAVTILDGVKGVQAQTIKVWQQAKRRGIPRICYINKMDRMGASILQAAQSIQQRLKVQPLIMQQPIGEADLFKGVYDLVTMQEVLFNGRYGESLQKSKLSKTHPRYKQLLQHRQRLIEQVGNYNDEIAELYMAEKEITPMRLKHALKLIMLNQHEHNLCPIYIGTSFKNKGVQPVMDAIIDFLPSPNERPAIHDAEQKENQRKPSKTQPLTGYVFKILYDLEMGPLAYTRIYSGEMKKNTNLLNSSINSPQKIGHIYRVRANQYVSVNHIHTGDIVAISGLKQTKAGQTLIEYGSPKFCLDPLQLPSAIFTVPFEVQSNKYLNAFKQAIEKATIQDDSLKYEFEPQTGQYLLSGLGELHLQILRDKLISDKIPVKMGSLKINYKQTIGGTIRDKLKIRKQLKPGMFEQFEIDVELVPLRTEDEKIQKKNNIAFVFDRIGEFDQNWREFLRRKLALHQSRKATLEGEDQTQENFGKVSKKSVRNPTPVEPIQEQFIDEDDDGQDIDDDDQQQTQMVTAKDEQGEQALYHISTLPFQTLYELYETCKVNLMYGRRNFPMTGVEIRIHNGIYTKSTFTKSILNRTTTELLRSLINSNALLLEPMMEFTLTGEEQMIDIALKDVLHKRGAIEEQQQKMITGKIPASEVRGWIKELRAMGLQVEMKFCDYQEVTGVDPNKLVERN